MRHQQSRRGLANKLARMGWALLRRAKQRAGSFYGLCGASSDQYGVVAAKTPWERDEEAMEAAIMREYIKEGNVVF